MLAPTKQSLAPQTGERSRGDILPRMSRGNGETRMFIIHCANVSAVLASVGFALGGAPVFACVGIAAIAWVAVAIGAANLFDGI